MSMRDQAARSSLGYDTHMAENASGRSDMNLRDRPFLLPIEIMSRVCRATIVRSDVSIELVNINRIIE
jgi:hypothetical protein